MKKHLFLLCFVVVIQSQAQSTLSNKPQKQIGSLPKSLLEIPLIEGNKGNQNEQTAAYFSATLLSARVLRDDNGNPIWIDYVRPLPAAANGKTSLATAALSYLKELKPLLLVKNPSEEFEVSDMTEDELQHTHIRLQQTYKGLPVYGGELILHEQNNTFTTLNGHHFKTPEMADVAPRLNAEQAAQKAQNDLKNYTKVRPLTMGELQLLKKQVSGQELLIYYFNETPHVAWRMVVRPNFIERWVYFIDAQTGNVLAKQNQTCTFDGAVRATGRDLNGASQTISAYQSGSNYYLIDITKSKMYRPALSTMPDDPAGVVWTIDGRNSRSDNLSYSQITSPNNTWSATAISAHYNAGLVYDYYLAKHGRNSVDGKGGNMLSMINVRDENGQEMDNAFYNGELMVYGNGLTDFTPLAGALDVAAHEITHGVTESTARLEYNGQSGAINESMSDVFGVLVDRTNWTIGEKVAKKSAYPSGALRDMSNPNQGGTKDPGYQPKTMSQYINTSQDDGGVHINSGIPNYAFFLFASNAAVGLDKSEKVYFRALTNYLTRFSQFKDLRNAIIKATSDLYGASGAEVAAAKSAFDQVGLTDTSTNPTPTPTPAPTTLPTNNGTEFLLATGVSDKKLYSSTTAGQNIVAKSSRVVVSRPSVTDDGKAVYMVNDDKRIRAVSLVGNPDETLISEQSETFWDRVAISKDGKKLAALTDKADKTIYVYSFDLKKWTKFALYNPTYSSTKTSDVQYADGIEWDASSEYLIYDAFNKVNTTTGKAVEYWDVGIIKVWSAVDNNFGDGKIQKLFSDLSDGESIGNPTFSKNSTAIIAFDYLNTKNNTYSVYGYDFQTNALKVITNNQTLGYPDYSRLDDKVIYSTLGTNNSSNVSVIGLNADKISGKGASTPVFSNAKWPLWVSQGTRQLPTINFAAISDKLQNTAPFTISATASTGDAVSFTVVSGPATISGNTVTVTGIGTVTIRAYTQPSRVFFPIAVAERTFNVTAILSTDPAIEKLVKIYPNPATDIVTVKLPQGILAESFELLGVAGNSVMNNQNVGKVTEFQIDINHIQTGVYHIGIETNKGLIWKKIMKQ